MQVVSTYSNAGDATEAERYLLLTCRHINIHGERGKASRLHFAHLGLRP